MCHSIDPLLLLSPVGDRNSDGVNIPLNDVCHWIDPLLLLSPVGDRNSDV